MGSLRQLHVNRDRILKFRGHDTYLIEECPPMNIIKTMDPFIWHLVICNLVFPPERNIAGHDFFLEELIEVNDSIDTITVSTRPKDCSYNLVWNVRRKD